MGSSMAEKPPASGSSVMANSSSMPITRPMMPGVHMPHLTGRRGSVSREAKVRDTMRTLHVCIILPSCWTASANDI